MPANSQHQIPPDFETRHTLAAALLNHLNVAPQHVDLNSLTIELGPDHRHRVTWTGHAHFNLTDLSTIIVDARLGPGPRDTDECTHPSMTFAGYCSMCGTNLIEP